MYQFSSHYSDKLLLPSEDLSLFTLTTKFFDGHFKNLERLVILYLDQSKLGNSIIFSIFHKSFLNLTSLIWETRWIIFTLVITSNKLLELNMILSYRKKDWKYLRTWKIVKMRMVQLGNLSEDQFRQSVYCFINIAIIHCQFKLLF